jgi:hypothetical protein
VVERWARDYCSSARGIVLVVSETGADIPGTASAGGSPTRGRAGSRLANCWAFDSVPGQL